MKTALCKLVSICVLNALIFSALQAQTCNFTDLRLNSQSAVNSFSSSCKTINGDITISGTDITDLSPLQNIETISGKLTIQNNPALSSLSGLKNLTTAQHLLIYTNNLLNDLSGLERLKFVGGSTHIRYNAGLADLKGLDSLTNASTFYITNNDSLTSLAGLGRLETVSDILAISANKSLVTLNGLTSLNSVSRINIGENDALTNLSGLEQLTSVSYQMNIMSNKKLTSLHCLTSLNYLSEAYISDNDLMTDLSGLEHVGSVYWLVIGDNGGLTSLNGLNNLTSATNFIIRYNESLTDLSGLENLTNVGWIQISDNAELKSLSGLGTGTNAGRGSANGRISALAITGLVIRNNPQLTSCAIAAVCDFTSTGEATITANGSGCESQDAIEIACSALPVTLTHFKVDAENGTALLRWTTAEERNSAVFEIEHSLDAVTWYKAGEEDATGESNALVHYQWVHFTPASGLNYYRLKMRDLDGSFTYSQIARLRFDGQTAAMVYPNPVSDIMVVENSKEIVQLQIISTEGRTVYETRSVPDAIPVKGLAAGMYQVLITRQNGTVQKQRIAIF
ncbi:Por secretion system C-terminal sorting domain-containing protein [Dyadobacter soli]|uniref:Por secretion system C-terminal sorting domain-containing protein n=1 Tax=Dyadobacter soli TaxID=659014 RepID=A0A1G7W4E8_9BACT|nr:T9SS type A sorting domain-containing protein [Dyadobacter soli]SDG66846.1 Por secretion system C-terminal sorting domain-containing protein [Dyadobacter soli]